MSNSTRIEYLDTLRGLAILIVVATHLQEIIAVSSIRTTGADYEAVGVLTVLFRNINIIFTFVSGFLFFVIDADRSWSSLMVRKWKNVIVPYLVVSLPALALYALGIKSFDFGDGYTVTEKIAYLVVTGNHLGPLWFVPMIILLFTLSPLWNLVDRKRAYWIILPMLVLAVAVERPQANDNPLQSAIFFAPVFLFGMLTARYRVAAARILGSREFLVVSALIVAATIWGLHLASSSLSAAVLNNTIYVSKFLLVALLFGICARWGAHAPGWLTTIGLASYSIFLLHGYFVGFLRALAPKLPVFEVMPLRMVTYLLLCSLVVAICYWIARMVRAATSPYNRLMIGF